MFIFKNAFISITRNKGRNILIGLVILVIAFASTITLAINNTASDLINSYKSSYDKELTISFNRENMMKDFRNSNSDSNDSKDDMKEKFKNISSYTIFDIEKFAESSHIKSYYYTYSISLNGKSIEKASSDNNDDKSRPGGDHGETEMDFTLTGYSSAKSMSEFIDGSYTMSQIADNAWDIAFDGNYIFINEELATVNNLNLNDKVTFEDSDGNTYEFEIIGIYKENTKDSSNEANMFGNSANNIITNSKALVNITKSNSNLRSRLNPTFIIDSYKNAKKIQKEFYKKGLDSNYVVETNEEKANASVSSIQNVKSFSSTFLIITLIIGGATLFIINMINIRERKYEIGVLRTIGISKVKLTLQFIIELSIVALASLIIGSGLGAIMSKDVSNYLLSNEIKSTQESRNSMKNNFGGPGGGPDIKMNGVANVEEYDSINAIVDIKVVGELLLIGLTLVLVSSSASMISIQRFSPLTILKERS